MTERHYQRPGSDITDPEASICACGRDKKTSRGHRGMAGGIYTTTMPVQVTCDNCKRHPDVKAFLASESAAATARAARIPSPGTRLAGYGSTATVVRADEQHITIRWVDGKIATLTERQLANFTRVDGCHTCGKPVAGHEPA